MTRTLDRLDKRTRANRELFAAESARIAALCDAMAERFLAGGRLLAVGRSPAARSDARHVAVEFVHPVIVGKRALPAVCVDDDPALLAEAGDMVVVFDADGAGSAPRCSRCSRNTCTSSHST